MSLVDENHREPAALADKVSRVVIIALLVVMSLELLWAGVQQQWLMVFLVGGIMAIIMVPLLFRARLPVQIPLEFHVLIILFIFASLFLGEVQNFYHRVWWWDTALHAVSGLLLGVMGFLLVFILNENERIEVYLRPRFVALFAFLFAVTVGALWEIFEFGMDTLFGMQMQKPMFNDPSGLTDTMWDLMLDAAGALLISVLGGWYLHRQQGSFMERWIAQFVASNPRLFLSGRSRH